MYTLITFVYLLLHHFSQSSQPKGCHPRPQSGQKLKINGNRARDGRISSRRWLENQWDSHGRSMSDLLADWMGFQPLNIALEYLWSHWTLPHLFIILWYFYSIDFMIKYDFKKSWNTYFPYRSQSTEGWTYIEPTRFIHQILILARA